MPLSASGFMRGTITEGKALRKSLIDDGRLLPQSRIQNPQSKILLLTPSPHPLPARPTVPQSSAADGPPLVSDIGSSELVRPHLYWLFGSHNSMRLPSGSVIHANRP